MPIHELKFECEDLSVPAGTQITFVNADNVSHSVKKVAGPDEPDFDSGPIEPGGTFSQTFSREGTYKIQSEERPTTDMTVEVSEEPIEEGTAQ